MTFAASLYHHAGSLFAVPRWRTVQGLDVPAAPVTSIDASAGDAGIGAAVVGVLAGYREGLPDEQASRGNDDNPVLAAAGVKRMSAFVKEAAHVHVWTGASALTADARVEIDASRRGRGGFDYLPGDPLVSTAEPAALGAAVRAAFARCVPPVQLGPAPDAMPAPQDAGRAPREAGPAGADVPAGFGPKTAWLAVRGRDPAAAVTAVVAVLGLRETAPAPWRHGVERAVAEDDLVFVTPPVEGWVLAVGAALGGWWPDEIAPRLGEVSRALGEVSRALADAEVHYYVTHRASEYAAWARARGGRTQRVLAFDGDTVEIGQPDAAELDLGLAGRSPGEDDVLAVAGAWSLDPTALDERGGPAGPGMLGRWPA